jgi:metallopeptidase MepB
MREDESRFTANKDFYLIIKAVKDRADPLGVEEAKYLDLMVTEFTRCGHGRLTPDQINVYLQNRDKIEKLKREFNRNIRNDNTGLWLSLDELDGVPEQVLALFPRCPDSDKEEMNEKCMRFVRFTKIDVDTVLQHARNPATRKRLYVANENKVPQNIGLFHETSVLRDKNARLLGYASHAAFRLETHIAKTPTWVNNLLDELEQSLLPQGRREMQALLTRKKQENSYGSNSIPPWDYEYYSHLVLEDLDVKHTQISEYFPLQNTVLAMLDIFSSCLQLQFVPFILTASSTWHEDVEAWSVWDQRDTTKGSFIGYLYTDLLWRPSKHKGSQNVNLQSGYLRGDGSRVYPATILMCSFPRPTSSGCAQLKHSEMVSYFMNSAMVSTTLCRELNTRGFTGIKRRPTSLKFLALC